MENAMNSLQKRKNPHAKKTKITFRQKFIMTTERETELTYKEFVENHMVRFDLDEMNETDEEFIARCDDAWVEVCKNSHNGVVILEDEEDTADDEDDYWDETHNDAVGQAIADAIPEDDRVLAYEALVQEKRKQEKKNREEFAAALVALRRAREEKSQQIARLREELLALGGDD